MHATPASRRDVQPVRICWPGWLRCQAVPIRVRPTVTPVSAVTGASKGTVKCRHERRPLSFRPKGHNSLTHFTDFAFAGAVV